MSKTGQISQERLVSKKAETMVKRPENDTAERMRAALRSIIDERGIPLATWCAQAGIPESSPRNFLEGRTNTLFTSNLIKMADALGLPIGRMIGESARTMRAAGHIISGGKIILAAMDQTMPMVEIPQIAGDHLKALVVDGKANYPEIDDLDVVYYRDVWEPPGGLIGTRCIIRLQDGSLCVGRLQGGTSHGAMTVQRINSTPLIDVVVKGATPILWIKPHFQAA